MTCCRAVHPLAQDNLVAGVAAAEHTPVTSNPVAGTGRGYGSVRIS